MNFEKLVRTLIICGVISPWFTAGVTILMIVLSLLGYWQVLLLLVAVQIYLLFFCKRWDGMIKYMIKQQPEKYFKKFEVICEEPFEKEKCMFPASPHHLFCIAINLACFRPPFENLQLLGSKVITSLGVHSILPVLYGWKNVAPKSFKEQMSLKKNIAFVPGGYEDSVISTDKGYRIYLRQRKGFIKYALQYGYNVYPTFVFNENKCYIPCTIFYRLRMWITLLCKGAILIFISRYFLVLPDPKQELYVVCGKKLAMP